MSNSDNEKHLRCVVCDEYYVDPKSLSCGHSFCLKCVQTMTVDGAIVCPECRKSTTIPPEGLPTNYGIRDAMSHSIRNLLRRTPSMLSLTSADTADGFSINFLKLNGDAFTLGGFKTSDEVIDVKQRVGQYSGIPGSTVFLVYGGKCFANGKKLEEYGIKAGSTVHVVTRFNGGKM